MEFKEKIQACKDYDIRNIIFTECNIEVGNKNTNCPICGGGVNSGCFSVKRNKFKCFSCGENGTTIDFLMKLYSMEFNNTVNDIAARYLNIIDEYKPTEKKAYKPIKVAAKVKESETINDKEVNNYFIQIVRSLQITNCKEYEYLKSRGFDEVVCAEYGLNWFTESNYQIISETLLNKFSSERLIKSGIFSKKGKLKFFKHRILISYKHNSDIYHLQARSLPAETQDIKYLFGGGERTVFNAQDLKAIPKDVKHLFFTEGAFDAISLELLYKAENTSVKAVSLGSVNGKVNVAVHILTFCKSRNIQPVFAFDNDKAGIEAKAKLMSKDSQLGSTLRTLNIPFAFHTATNKDYNNDLIELLKNEVSGLDPTKYNVNTTDYMDCLKWLEGLDNYNTYDINQRFLSSLSFLNDTRITNFRIINNNTQLTTLQIKQ